MSGKTSRALPQYSETGLDARDVMMKDVADCFFYFEDAGQEALYDRLVRRLFPTIPRARVLCLGGCTKVISKLRSPDTLGVPRIGIVDLDFNDLLGQMPEVKNLVSFNKQCFENYLIDFAALINVAIEELDPPPIFDDAANQANDYEAFFDNLVNEYTEVTRYFVTARRQRIPIATTKIPASELVEAGSPGLSEMWFESYKRKFRDACEDDHAHLLQHEILTETLAAAFDVPDGGTRVALVCPLDHLSGKHLLYIVTHYIDQRLGSALLSQNPLARYLKLVNHVPVEGFETIVKNCWQALLPQLEGMHSRVQVPPEYSGRAGGADAIAA